MTALTHMAAPARPPGISDARVPCPLCGGLIHPVAGRCKHCKQDLSQFRAGRPQAAAPLPSLATSNGNGQVAVPVAVAAHEASQPILPPRPTGRSVAAQSPHPAWRSWPVVVIVLACAAIVTAVVIMVWPPSPEANRHSLQPPPAPERMETNPLPPTGQANPTTPSDPWGGHSQNDPPVQRHVPDPLPANPPPTQTPDDTDVFGGIVGGQPGGLGQPDFMFTALGHACQKLKGCPNTDQTLLSTLCDTVSMLPNRPAPTGCAAAQRCLDAIDKLNCSQTGFANPNAVVFMFQDCTTAATRC